MFKDWVKVHSGPFGIWGHKIQNMALVAYDGCEFA